MTTTRHYDVIVLGRSLGALLTAALLARRELRVLVLGQGNLDAQYKIEDHQLERRAFTLLSATSPAFRRIIQELAQTQKFRRLTTPLDPMFSVLTERSRFEVPPDVELFSREIEREFPEVRKPIAELYADISTINGLVDDAFERDAVWPPGTLWERVETARLSGHLPLVEDNDKSFPLLDRLPRGHAFAEVLELPAVFASHLGLDASALPPLALARLHGSWTRGIHSLPGGEQALEDFLIERIRAHGGVCRLRSRATALVISRGRVVGVREDGEGEVTGTESLVTTGTGEGLAELSGGDGITRKARDNWPHVESVGGRFVTSLVVRPELWPAPLGKESFLVPRAEALPIVHLQDVGAHTTAARSTQPPGQARRLVAEVLLPSAGGPHLLGAREAVLATMREYFPFLDEHLILVDSCYDGLPAWSYADQAGRRVRRDLERVHLPHATTLAEPMPARLTVRPRGYLGLGGEPVRGPIPGTYLVGPSVLPALGQEGEVLAAWSVARILTSRDKSRQKMRRQMWTKIET